MFIKITCFFLSMLVVPAYAALGPNLLAHSPSGYLLDLDKRFFISAVTRQIGNELFERDYSSTIPIIENIPGRFDERPTEPAVGYTFDQGQWVWIPDSLNDPVGVWHWVARTMSAYMAYLLSVIIPF